MRKYDTRAHRKLRAQYRKLVDSGQGWCAEVICLEEREGRTRWIPPGSPIDAAHAIDGVTYLGPAHARCNRADGARRGNRMRTRPRRRKL